MSVALTRRHYSRRAGWPSPTSRKPLWGRVASSSGSDREPSRLAAATRARRCQKVQHPSPFACVPSALVRHPTHYSAGRPRLLNPALALYISSMIAVKAENGCLQVTIPTEGMTPGEVNDFFSWLRVESVVRRSRFTPEAAWKLSEDIKSDWWQANERRLTPEGVE